MTHPLLIKLKINKLNKALLRDKYGNILGYPWNGIVMKEIRELEKQLEEEIDYSKLKALLQTTSVIE